MRIWKWDIETTDIQVLEMPKGAQVLTVQMQDGKPRLWALCDEEAPVEKRTFAVCGTGNPIPGNLHQYIGTYQLYGGSLVFHVFECAKPSPRNTADTPCNSL